jgi:hypothetical protein
MHYWVILFRRGEISYHYDYFLDGLIPRRVLEMTRDRFADELGLCRTCDLATRCHVIEEPGGRKYCPILFHDVVRPAWKIEELG